MKQILTKIDRFFCKKWHLCVLDMGSGRWVVSPDTNNIPYLKAENANGRHILIQPQPKIQPYYLLVDDVDWDILARHHQIKGKWKRGRMVVETSPENYQVWIHSERFISLEEKRFWLKKLLSDPGADPNNRWGRCPGFRNRKEKYEDSNGYFPLSKLLWIDWKHQAKIPNLFPHQPRGFVCHNKNISRSDYSRKDDSATDFAFALALFRRGFSEDNVKDQILQQRSNWNNHKGDRRINQYLDRTIQKAKLII